MIAPILPSAALTEPSAGAPQSGAADPAVGAFAALLGLAPPVAATGKPGAAPQTLPQSILAGLALNVVDPEAPAPEGEPGETAANAASPEGFALAEPDAFGIAFVGLGPDEAIEPPIGEADAAPEAAIAAPQSPPLPASPPVAAASPQATGSDIGEAANGESGSIGAAPAPDARAEPRALSQPPQDARAPNPQTAAADKPQAATAVAAPAPTSFAALADAAALPHTHTAAHAPVHAAIEPQPHAPRPLPDLSAISQSIASRFNGQSTTIAVRLEPAELGRIDVRLEVAEDNSVTAAIAVDNPVALTELTRASRDLERALSDAGLNVSASGLSFNLAQRDARQDSRPEAQRGPVGADTAPALDEPAAARRASPVHVQTWRAERVDLLI